jgi:hypothetical protein
MKSKEAICEEYDQSPGRWPGLFALLERAAGRFRYPPCESADWAED